MRRIIVFLLILMLTAGLLLPVTAQEETETPDPEVTPEVTQEATPTEEPTDEATEEPIDQEQQPEVTEEATEEVPPLTDVAEPQTTVRFRIAHLVSDGPPIVTYINGISSNIQLLAYPDISGWVEFPGESIQLAFVPQGGAQSQAIGSPITLSAGTGFNTIVLVGSAQGGSVQSVRLSEQVANLSQDCARVTILHAIEGAPAVDLVLDDGTVIASGVGFPSAAGGGQSQAGNQQENNNLNDLFAGCVDAETAQAASVIDCQALPVGGTTTTTNQQNQNQTPVATATQQTTEQQDTDTEQTNQQDTDTEQTNQQGTDTQQTQTSQVAQGMGQTFANCGYTFDVPAGTYNLQVNAAGTQDVLLNLGQNLFTPGTHFFIAVIGSPEAPDVFTYSLDSALLSGFTGEGQPPAEATPEPQDDVGDDQEQDDAGDDEEDDEEDDQPDDDPEETPEATEEPENNG